MLAGALAAAQHRVVRWPGASVTTVDANADQDPAQIAAVDAYFTSSATSSAAAKTSGTANKTQYVPMAIMRVFWGQAMTADLDALYHKLYHQAPPIPVATSPTLLPTVSVSREVREKIILDGGPMVTVIKVYTRSGELGFMAWLLHEAVPTAPPFTVAWRR